MVLGTIFAGTALWVLTRSPPSVQDIIVQVLQRLPFSVKKAALITIAKWLLGIGIVRYASSTLSEAAFNNWRFSSDSRRWDWSDEVAVVTGACSGIGEEIAKSLSARGVRIVALDMAPLPERLKNGELSKPTPAEPSRHVVHQVRCHRL